MTNGLQHNSFDPSAHAHPAASVSAAPELKPFLVAVVGIILGILAGAFLAARTVQADNIVASADSVHAATPVPAPPVRPAAVAAAPVAVVQPLPPAPTAHAAVSAPAATTRHRTHRYGLRRVSFSRRRLRSHRSLRLRYTPAIATVVQPSLPPSVEDSSPSLAFFVEGGLTAVNYDSEAGTLETYEGQTFAIDRSTAKVSTLPTQEYPVNVHYRCDQAGNCTLNWPGIAGLTAKRTQKADLSL